MTDRRSTADSVVEGLLAHGIDTLYCLPGVQNDPFFDAIFHVQPRLRPIHARHEQGAGYMALGAALATGRPQAMCVVPGPGLLNAGAALATAFSTGAKVVLIVGQIPQPLIGRQLGALHEIEDQAGLLRGLTKWWARIRGPGEAPALVAEAFRQLQTGRPRPVALEVPMDVWSRTAPATPVAPYPRPVPPRPDPEAVAAAATLLHRAERPLILVGGGAQDAAEPVRRLAEALDSPVSSYRMGRGVVDARHPLCIGLPATHAAWGEADVVLAVGTRLTMPLMHWGVDAGLRIIRVDLDPAEPRRIAAPEVELIADASDALTAIADALPERQPDPERRARIRSLEKKFQDRIEAKLPPQLGWLRAIRSAVPDDGILIEEMTQIGYAARIAWPAYHPRTYLSSGYQGNLGWGFATALGAKAANPDRAVVVICGDGGFMFTVQELSTAVNFRIPLVAIVFNDGAFGNVRLFQKAMFGNRTIATELVNPDFAELARAFGARGVKAGSPGELEAAVREGLAAELPTVIEVPQVEMPSPWEFISMPRVRGEQKGSSWSYS